MTLKKYNNDMLYLHMKDKDGFLMIPLCEVVAGKYSRNADNEHVLTTDAGTSETYDQLNFCKLLVKDIESFGTTECWVIQPEGQEPSKDLVAFVTKYSTQV